MQEQKINMDGLRRNWLQSREMAETDDARYANALRNTFWVQPGDIFRGAIGGVLIIGKVHANTCHDDPADDDAKFVRVHFHRQRGDHWSNVLEAVDDPQPPEFAMVEANSDIKRLKAVPTLEGMMRELRLSK